jgi:hypothetical protein
MRFATITILAAFVVSAVGAAIPKPPNTAAPDTGSGRGGYNGVDIVDVGLGRGGYNADSVDETDGRGGYNADTVDDTDGRGGYNKLT